MCLIGIDFGTTHCKAGAFSSDGRQLAIATAHTPAHADAYGTVWYPEEVWKTISGLVREVVAKLDPSEEVEGISASSVGESFILMDAHGEPVFPIIAWYDSRTLDQRDWWAQKLGEKRLREITGLPLDPIYSVNKLMWIREHAPEAYARGRRALLMADWITYKLCGSETTNYSLASRTMAFDLRSRKWSSEITQAAGIPEDIFGEAVPSSTRLGSLLPNVARELGLRPDIPVFAGGQDHICASLGAGLVGSGRMLNSTGTAETVLTIVGPDADISPMMTPGLTMGAHIFGNAYNAMATMRASGASIEWAIRELLGIAPDAPPDVKYGRFMDELRIGKAADTGLLFFPLLRGSLTPVNQPTVAGAFVGLRDTHTRTDMTRAVLEGVSLESAYMIEYLTEVTGVKPERVIAVGGGAKNPIWLQTKADILNLPVDVPSVGESAVFGAALLAGIGAGVYKDASEAGSTAGTAKTYTPDTARCEVYKKALAKYKEVREYILKI